MDKGSHGALIWARCSSGLVLCIIICVSIWGCRRESPPETPPLPEPTHAEQPVPVSPPDSSPETAPRDDRQPDSTQPPRVAKVTILSTEPIPAGATDDEHGRPHVIEGGVVYRPSEMPAAVAPRTGQRRPQSRKGNPRSNPLQGIELELVKKWNAIQSLTSKLETYVHSKTEDHEITTEGVGTRDCLKKDGKTLVRLFFGHSIKIEVETENPPIRWTGRRVTKVYDGEYVYTQTDTHEGKTATKELPASGSFMAVGGPGLIATLRSARKLKRMPDTEIDGHSMYVFTGYSPISVRVEYVIAKETGLLRKVVRKWTDADRIARFNFVTHEINPGFSEGHFTFTPGEGVEVEDRTGTVATPPPTDPQP